MSYYINSPIGKIYFRTFKNTNIIIMQTNNSIKKLNISFASDNLFYQLTESYDWMYMKMISMNDQNYLCIYLQNNTCEFLDIGYDYYYFYNKNDYMLSF
jgi:hypothetical protein